TRARPGRRHRPGQRLTGLVAFANVTRCPAAAGIWRLRGGLAQLGERLNGIQEVRGSNPLSSTSPGPVTRPRVTGPWLFRLPNCRPTDMADRLTEFLDAATAAARRGGAVLQAWRDRVQVREKAPFDLVTEADLECQRVVREFLSERFPDHGFLGEE